MISISDLLYLSSGDKKRFWLIICLSTITSSRVKRCTQHCINCLCLLSKSHVDSRNLILTLILGMLHSQNIIPRIWKIKIVKWVNFCMTLYYYLRNTYSNYCSFWLRQTVLTKITASVLRHTHNVQFIVMFSYKYVFNNSVWHMVSVREE